MAAGILIPQKGYFSDWNDPSALPGELGDSLMVFDREGGRMFARRCSDDRCERTEDADTTATMCGIPLDSYHGEWFVFMVGISPLRKRVLTG